MEPWLDAYGRSIQLTGKHVEWPTRLYRAWQAYDYDDAERFLQGRIKLTTLEYCRSKEMEQLRHDSKDGKHTYYSDEARARPYSGEETRKIGANLGVELVGEIDKKSYFAFVGCTAQREIKDAYLLCFARTPDALKEFGPYIVEINQPELLARAIYKRLPQYIEGNFDFRFGWIEYAEPVYRGAQDPPGDLGFVKEPRFASNEEFRILVRPVPLKTPLARLSIVVREARELVHRYKPAKQPVRPDLEVSQ